MRIICIFLLLLGSRSSLALEAAMGAPTLQPLAIDSAVLGEARQLMIYLPAGYQDGQHRYPVLYLTDGDIHGNHTAGTLDYQAKFNLAPHMIVVGIVNPPATRQRDLTLAATDLQNGGQRSNPDLFLRFIETEVIPLVKQRYRTLDYQALSGTSHGGQFAINVLLQRPGLFQGVIAISPSLWWNNQQMLALTETALQRQQLQGRLYVSIANEEPMMTEPFAKFIALTKRYPATKLVLAQQTFANETHNTTVLQGQYYGLKHLFADWVIPENVPQTLADLQAVYQKRSSLLGISLQIPQDRAAGFGQWLQYLNRQQDALALLQWNRQTYPQSLNAHQALIKAYLHFKLMQEAKTALTEALQQLSGLSEGDQAALRDLLPSAE